MGFFSKMKSSLTGDWATVTVDCPGGKIDEEISFIIRASIKNEAIDVDRIYLNIRSEEEIHIPNYRVHDRDEAGDTDYYTIRESEETYSRELTVEGAQSLEANREYEWNGSFTIPGSYGRSYHGKHAKHIYKIFAGLDMKGNDPDSGWIEVDIL